MQEIKLLNADIFLARKVKGIRLISDVLCWWQNSKVAAHVGVITNASNLEVFDARIFQKNKLRHIDYFFDGTNELTFLRYNKTNKKERDIIISFLNSIVGDDYDNSSIASLVINREIENPKKYNCAEAALRSFQAGGKLTNREIDFILPHSFWEYYIADRFELLGQMKCPTKDDLKYLI